MTVLSIEMSQPDGNSSQPSSFKANLIISNCRTSFRSSQRISISSRRLRAISGDGHRRLKMNKKIFFNVS